MWKQLGRTNVQEQHAVNQSNVKCLQENVIIREKNARDAAVLLMRSRAALRDSASVSQPHEQP